MASHTARFVKERETKGTYVYRELNAKGQPIESNREGLVGYLYIQKNCPIGKASPDEIKVTIEYGGS